MARSEGPSRGKRRTSQPADTRILDVAAGQLVTRVLGMNSLPVTVSRALPEFTRWAEGKGATVTPIKLPRPWKGVRARGIDMGLGIRLNAYLVGAEKAPNVFLVREEWWKARVLEGPRPILRLLRIGSKSLTSATDPA